MLTPVELIRVGGLVDEYLVLIQSRWIWIVGMDSVVQQVRYWFAVAFEIIQG